MGKSSTQRIRTAKHPAPRGGIKHLCKKGVGAPTRNELEPHIGITIDSTGLGSNIQQSSTTGWENLPVGTAATGGINNEISYFRVTHSGHILRMTHP